MPVQGMRSGVMFDIFHPTPGAIQIEDIAVGLA